MTDSNAHRDHVPWGTFRGRLGRSDPERHFQMTHRGSIGGPFDRGRPLHWVAVLWNAARVSPDSPDYLNAQATVREARAVLTHLERQQSSGDHPVTALAGDDDV